MSRPLFLSLSFGLTFLFAGICEPVFSDWQQVQNPPAKESSTSSPEDGQAASSQEVGASKQLEEAPQAEGDGPLAKQYFEEGKYSYDEGNYSDALDSFRKSLYEDPANTTLNFLMGRAAYEAGNYEEAVFSFQRALIINPNLQVARLELARSQIALGNINDARKELEKILASPVPLDVRRNVELLLSQIDEGQKPRLNGAVVLSYIFDSNATLGTGSVPIPGFPGIVTLPTNRSDRIFRVAAAGELVFPTACKGLNWKNTALGYFSDNQKVDANDLLIWVFGTGFQYGWKRNLFEAAISWTSITLQEQLYQSNPAISLDWTHIYSDRLSFRAGWAYYRRHQFMGAGVPRTQTRGMLNQAYAGILFLQDDRNIWDFGFLWRYDKTPRDAVPPLAFHRYELALRYTRILSEYWSINLAGIARDDHYRHNEVAPGFTSLKRFDHALMAEGSATYKYCENLELRLGLSYIDNDSNVAIHKYYESQFFTNLIYTF